MPTTDVTVASMVRRLVSPRFTSLLLALALPLGCSKTGDTPAEEGGAPQGQDSGAPDERPPLFNPDPSPPAPKDLVPALDGPSVGMQPGYLDGAFLFASMRAGTLQEFGQSLPLAPGEARDLAELGSILGADPRVDDVLAHLGIDPDARTSLSIRPVVDHAAAVKQTIDQGGALFDELHRPVPEPGAPAAPPLSADAELLLDRVESLGVHVRWHAPLKDPSKTKPLFELMSKRPHNEWTTTCATLQPTLVCLGESDALFVLREVPGAVQVDALLFFVQAHDEHDTEIRRTLAQQAIALPVAQSIPGVGALRGDANLLVASTPTFHVLRANEMARAVRSVRWDGPQALGDYRKFDDALRAVHDVDRVFDGIKIEARVGPQRVLANLAWLPTPLGKQKMAEMFALSQVDADVPALASLCEGSLMCARSRGLPSTANFAALATGPFADPELLEGTFEYADDDEIMLLLMLESWPNLIGLLGKFPGQSMQPPESVIAENARKAAERVLAFGVAVRKLEHVAGQTNVEYVAFARMPEMDLSTLRGLVRMGQAGLAPVTIEGVPGSIESAALPDDDLPGRFYSISDPPVATGSWGWAVAADGDERVRWMAGLPRDDGAAPIAYYEIADLWRLIAGVDELARDLGHAQAWLSGRSLRAQWSQTQDGPEVRAVLEKAR
jgi:hypothetical protein